MAVMRIAGPEAEAAFQGEGGVHRWQRAESSTVAVTVLPEPDETQLALRRQDLRWQSTPGGGMARATGVIVTHPPSGLTVCCDGGLTERLNRDMALALLRARLFAQAARKKAPAPRGVRRTLSVARGEVTDHALNQRWPLAEYLLGVW